MSWTLPSTAIEQMNSTQGINSSGKRSVSYSWKGPYSDLKTAEAALVKGDEIKTGWRATEWRLTRIAGQWGELSITCSATDTETSEGQTSHFALDEIWSIKSVRNDVSILAYIDGSVFPEMRAAVEMWMREQDADLVGNYMYKRADGTIFDVSAIPGASGWPDGNRLKKIMDKLARGTESVMRFYPLLTKRSRFSSPPDNVLEKLACIDIPAASTEGGKTVIHAPKNLATIIAAHQWLKCQDDCEESENGDWWRTEAWMGILKSNSPSDFSPWDTELYAATEQQGRWEMPAIYT